MKADLSGQKNLIIIDEVNYFDEVYTKFTVNSNHSILVEKYLR